MKEQLVVYAYNVMFGDGILIEVPDKGTQRFILIDVGNVFLGAPGANKPLLPAVQDIKGRTGGHIDLYVMTHEHLDHVQGLLYAKSQGTTLDIDHIWMTASADKSYYDTHPEAQIQRKALQDAAAASLAAFGSERLPEALAGIQAMNDVDTTSKCVDYLRGAGQHVHYMHRESEVKGTHPFKEVALRILAPEEDTSHYYATRGRGIEQTTPRVDYPPDTRPLPPGGIDGGSFYNLIDRMNSGLVESLFTIDQANNNTSLVIELEWRGLRLLFVGDAEQKSWVFMGREGQLRPVDFLKVGHHGSINGTPPPVLLDMVLPMSRRNSAVALVSTCPCAWKSVPDQPTLNAIAARTKKLYDTRSAQPGTPLRIAFSGTN